MYKITQKYSNALWTIPENDRVCIVSCLRHFVYIILIFSGLYDAYIVKRQYTGLPKSNRRYCLALEAFFGSWFKMVSNKNEKYQ